MITLPLLQNLIHYLKLYDNDGYAAFTTRNPKKRQRRKRSRHVFPGHYLPSFFPTCSLAKISPMARAFPSRRNVQKLLDSLPKVSFLFSELYKSIIAPST
ncbi:hypothetical protein TNCT_291711 [Trichonephila clavata]|uniref:Uncharacterized protein n=1 Tax=Trichonephila clavata TaxID=2740835 RepID=A0A8X6JCF7_TRICU|nr:hypothetical protein TNCT_291711 [Trichonephila clavata]